MFCSNCGKEISNGSKFCVHCGAVIESSTVKPEITQNVKSSTINYNQANISQRESFGLREYLNWKYGRGIEKSEGFLNSALKRIKDLKNSKNAEIICGDESCDLIRLAKYFDMDSDYREVIGSKINDINYFESTNFLALLNQTEIELKDYRKEYLV